MANRGGKTETVANFLFLSSKITTESDCSHEMKRRLLLGRKPMINLVSMNADKHSYSQSYSFISSHVWMWELDHKEGWVPNNWCFWAVMLEETLESPLDCKETKPANPKGNQSWIFFVRTDAKAPILRPPDVKSWLIGKYPDGGKDWKQEEKGVTENEVVGWHQRFNGHEFEQTMRDSEGRGSLACCSPWSCKESGTA